ncbi:hypothetical protein [Modestobacter roseus]|uniref:hypothetical protein n=1 Tax=Modestobacter roseus TaxID=1181884 RepID=UPI0013209F74|nr:hypothetical protein [Modestobacter roseus]
MPEHDDAADERLLHDLARVARDRDPVPTDLLEFARQSLTWRTVDAELAELTADSHEVARAVRTAGDDVRLLTFSAGDLRLDVEVLAEGATRRLVGELSPAQPARVVLEHTDGTLTEDTDELGRFLLDGVPVGLVRLRCTPEGGPGFITPWLHT